MSWSTWCRKAVLGHSCRSLCWAGAFKKYLGHQSHNLEENYNAKFLLLLLLICTGHPALSSWILTYPKFPAQIQEQIIFSSIGWEMGRSCPVWSSFKVIPAIELIKSTIFQNYIATTINSKDNSYIYTILMSVSLSSTMLFFLAPRQHCVSLAMCNIASIALVRCGQKVKCHDLKYSR